MTDRTWSTIQPRLEALLYLLFDIPWRSILYWLFMFLVASIIAVELLAVFQPLYDMTHWRMPQ